MRIFKIAQKEVNRMNDLGTSCASAEELLKTVQHIRYELATRNRKEALVLAEKMEQSLSAESAPERIVLGEIYLLLARVHIQAAELGGERMDEHISRSEDFIAKAEHSLATSIAASDQIAALRAWSLSLRQGADTALTALAGSVTPHSLRARIAFLLNQQKTHEAMTIVHGLEPHEWWCDLAVCIYALNDKLQEASAIVRWSARLPDRTRFLQCCVQFAEGVLTRWTKIESKNTDLEPDQIKAEDRVRFLLAVETLSPALDLVRIADMPSNALDVAALQASWSLSYLLQQRDAAAESLRLMAKWTPVPVDVARGVMQGFIKAPPDLPERLRHDHPGELTANLLASLIESYSFGRHQDAYNNAKSLIPLADTDRKKEELFGAMQIIWHYLNGPNVESFESLAIPLIEHNRMLRTLFDATVELRHRNPDVAIRILDGHKDDKDIRWLQIRANACLQKKDNVGAVSYLLLAAKINFNPELVFKIGTLAGEAKQFDVAVSCFEQVLEILPDNVPARNNLAHIYMFVLRDLEKSAIQFRELHRLKPADLTYTFNLATCLAQLFLPNESLSLFDEVCRCESPPLQAVIGRAQLRHALGDPETAFENLDAFRKIFWKEQSFVIAYINIAYAAGREEAAREALLALNDMQKAGSGKPEVFKAFQKEEGLELFKQSFKQSQERDSHLHREMICGRMPWVWVEQVSNSALYYGWISRTQELQWIGDEASNRARLCVYSTNGFAARRAENGQSALLRLECPSAGTKVVADISALITFHRLGMLETIMEYFGEVLVPVAYLPTVLEDSRRMVLHQKSIQKSAEKVGQLIREARIHVLHEYDKLPDEIAQVDEYTEAEEHRYSLRDLIQPVCVAGGLKEKDYALISRAFVKPSAVDDAHVALKQFQMVMVDLLTLETVAQAGLLDRVAEFYQLLISMSANREVTQRLKNLETQEKTRLWHMDLWTRIKADTRFKFVQHRVPEEMRKMEGDEKSLLAFVSCFVAQEMKLPLLADDRVCQMFRLNDPEGIRYASFGSDALIMQLIEDGKMEVDKGAALISQLMTWRYRFIVPTPAILKAFAAGYKSNLPGRDLREVANYAHDCLRDAGLFVGREKTDMGDSLAMRTYLTWVSVIAEFLVLVWADSRYTSGDASDLTSWACSEFIPPLPRFVDGKTKVRVSEMTSRLILSHALMNVAGKFGEPRMAEAMKAIQNGLVLNDDEYQNIVMGILNDTARTTPQS
jgi:tetratricopeptide (TPR) repeat protein